MNIMKFELKSYWGGKDYRGIATAKLSYIEGYCYVCKRFVEFRHVANSASFFDLQCRGSYSDGYKSLSNLTEGKAHCHSLDYKSDCLHSDFSQGGNHSLAGIDEHYCDTCGKERYHLFTYWHGNKKFDPPSCMYCRVRSFLKARNMC